MEASVRGQTQELGMTNLGSRGLLLLVLLLLLGWGAVADSVPLDPTGWPIQRELLPHSPDRAKAVELFWAKPEGNGPFSAILFIHGHQEPSRPGGSVYAKTGRLALMAKRGFVAAAMSQPVYGNSAGPPDFCGPFTQQAAFAALDFLRRETFVKPGKVALFGYSRGAIVAAMVATQDSALATVVLGADERIPVQQTEAFAEQLRSVGVTYRVKIFPAAPHDIPIDEQWREVDPFL